MVRNKSNVKKKTNFRVNSDQLYSKKKSYRRILEVYSVNGKIPIWDKS